MTSASHVNTALDVNGFHQHRSSSMKGDDQFLDLHGAWAENVYKGL